MAVVGRGDGPVTVVSRAAGTESARHDTDRERETGGCSCSGHVLCCSSLLRPSVCYSYFGPSQCTARALIQSSPCIVKLRLCQNKQTPLFHKKVLANDIQYHVRIKILTVHS